MACSVLLSHATLAILYPMNTYFHVSPRTIRELRRVQMLLERLDPLAAPQALIASGLRAPRGSVVVFPGSFNPPTTAHLALLKQAQRFIANSTLSTLAGKRGRKVYLYAAMSKRTTDKELVERPLMLDRIMLLRLLLRRYVPHAGIMLFNRGLYVEQAQTIRAAFPDVGRVYFLVGYDKIVQILDPLYYEDRDASLRELFGLAHVLVAPRGVSGAGELAELLQQPQNRPFAHAIHPLPFAPTYRDMSSSRIREQPSTFERDVPQEVRRFMRETRAYDGPLHLPDGTEVDYYGERVRAMERLLRR